MFKLIGRRSFLKGSGAAIAGATGLVALGRPTPRPEAPASSEATFGPLVARIEGGQITEITVTNVGSGYTDRPIVTITN